MNVDRYITPAVCHDGWASAALGPNGDEDVRDVLRAVLPGILTQHRADVLDWLTGELIREFKAGDPSHLVVAAIVRKAREAHDAVIA